MSSDHGPKQYKGTVVQLSPSSMTLLGLLTDETWAEFTKNSSFFQTIPDLAFNRHWSSSRLFPLLHNSRSIRIPSEPTCQLQWELWHIPVARQQQTLMQIWWRGASPLDGIRMTENRTEPRPNCINTNPWSSAFSVSWSSRQNHKHNIKKKAKIYRQSAADYRETTRNKAMEVKKIQALSFTFLLLFISGTKMIKLSSIKILC